MKKLLALLPFIIPYLQGALFSFRYGLNSYIKKRGKVTVIKTNGQLEIDNHVQLWPNVKLSCVGTSKKQAKIKIGAWTSIGDNTQIHAGELVSIGSLVKISWNVNILDRDYHAVEDPHGEKEVPESIKPIIIKDRAWIACGSIILKGVTIGEGAVVAAGSVVTKDVAPWTIVAGNPAKEVKKLKQASGDKSE